MSYRAATASWRGILAVAVCLPAPFTPAVGQTLVAGQRVRLTMPEARIERQVGTLAALANDSVTILRVEHARAPRGGTADTVRVTVPLGAVFRFEVSEGPRPRRPLRGAIWGTAIGAVVGVTYGGGAYLNCLYQGSRCQESEGQRRFVRWLLGVSAAGTVTGALLGLSTKERWVPVNTNDLRRLRVGVVAPPQGGLGLGAAVTF